ncbi:unnamed protein product [Adineta ricciae]|uniref:DUF7164 domain-containing protein n=1 Tax=Adineta ricciae TaxID=249248 RepID=A0A815LNU1_ADIRI|nr:unnamed protein product [Adineta ricciae]
MMSVKIIRNLRLVIALVTLGATYFLVSSFYSSSKEVSTTTTTTTTVPILSNKTVPSLVSSKPKEKNTIRVAVVVSLAKQTSHIAEFHLLYDSWRFLEHFSPLSQQVKVDLIVFCEQPSCSQLPSFCLPLSFNNKLQPNPSCFYEELSVKIVEEWNDYLYMTSIAFLLTPQYRSTILKYDWILRVDQDAIISPALLFGLLNKHPVKLYDMQFGSTGHGTEFTYKRIRDIAKKLGYKHMGIHNLCSTWLVHPNDSIQIANLTTIIGRHFLKNEYGPHVPGRSKLYRKALEIFSSFLGIENLPAIGEWPKWWRGVTSLYAASIAINHIYSSTIAAHHQSPAIDHPSFSTSSIWHAWHIHSLHNSEPFAKFQHRGHLQEFINEDPAKRIIRMSNTTYTQEVLNAVIKEFREIYYNNGKFNGIISVRTYVTALAWQKAHAATGAINLN